MRLLSSARRRFDERGMVWEAARTRRLLAVALEGAGRPAQAAAEQAAADAGLAALGAVNDRIVDDALAALAGGRLGRTA